MTGVSLRPMGGDVTLVDISASGLLARSGKRVAAGLAVTVVLQGSEPIPPIAGRVVRCEVGGIAADGPILYNVAVAFDQQIEMPDEDGSSPALAGRGPLTESMDVANRW